MIGLKIALAGLISWGVFGLWASTVNDNNKGLLWYVVNGCCTAGMVAIPIGFIIWVAV